MSGNEWSPGYAQGVYLNSAKEFSIWSSQSKQTVLLLLQPVWGPGTFVRVLHVWYFPRQLYTPNDHCGGLPGKHRSVPYVCVASKQKLLRLFRFLGTEEMGR